MADLSSSNTLIQLTIELVLVLPQEYTFQALLSRNSWRMILSKLSNRLNNVMWWAMNMLNLTSASIDGSLLDIFLVGVNASRHCPLCYMEKGRSVSSIWMRFKLEPSNSKESCKKYLYFVIFKVFTEILGHKDMIY